MGYGSHTTTSSSPPSSLEAVWVQSYALPAASSTNATSTSRTQIRENGSIGPHLLPVNARRDIRAGRPAWACWRFREEAASTVVPASNSTTSSLPLPPVRLAAPPRTRSATPSRRRRLSVNSAKDSTARASRSVHPPRPPDQPVTPHPTSGHHEDLMGLALVDARLAHHIGGEPYFLFQFQRIAHAPFH